MTSESSRRSRRRVKPNWTRRTISQVTLLPFNIFSLYLWNLCDVTLVVMTHDVALLQTPPVREWVLPLNPPLQKGHGRNTLRLPMPPRRACAPLCSSLRCCSPAPSGSSCSPSPPPTCPSYPTCLLSTTTFPTPTLISTCLCTMALHIASLGVSEHSVMLRPRLGLKPCFAPESTIL